MSITTYEGASAVFTFADKPAILVFISLLVADYKNGDLRGYAKFDAERLAELVSRFRLGDGAPYGDAQDERTVWAA